MARLDASQVVDDSRMSPCRGLGLPWKLMSATKIKLSESEPLGYKKEWNNAGGEGNGLASKRLQELQHQVFSAEMK